MTAVKFKLSMKQKIKLPFNPDTLVNFALGVSFLITAPFRKAIYAAIDPNEPNYIMGVFCIAFFLFSLWVNLSMALFLKDKYYLNENAKAVGGIFIFLSLFQYFLLLYAIPHYFDLPKSIASKFYLGLFGLTLFSTGLEMYVFYSERTNFKWLLKNENPLRAMYLALVGFSTWFIWEIQMLGGPKPIRTAHIDIMMVYIITYTFTVITFKRYYKVENRQLNSGIKSRIINVSSFLFSYTCMLISAGI